MTRRFDRASAVRVLVRSSDSEDRGVGIVVVRRPFTLLVPTHLIVLVEDGKAASVVVGETELTTARIVPAPALERDHLSLLRFGRGGPRRLPNARLPRRAVRWSAGQPIAWEGPEDAPPRRRAGRVVDVRERHDGTSIVTDIQVAPGESGGAVLVSGRLAGVCQGMTGSGRSTSAVAVPLSDDGLSELRRIRQRIRIRARAAASATLLVLVLVVGGFALHSRQSFVLASAEVPEDGSRLVAYNAQRLTLWTSWHRSFETPIRRYDLIAESEGGDPIYVAVGTIPLGGVNGAFVLLDRTGQELWSYSVRDGECIYNSDEETFDRYLVDGIYAADLDGDEKNELLVVFVHDHFYPCKLVVFDPSGEILAEYWHPGYIRTVGFGRVGSEPTPLTVVGASNNAIKTDWWNPQSLFAFRGLDIAGQAPPYRGTNGTADAVAPGTELWYRVIENVDPERLRAKCYKIDVLDADGDAVPEIRAALTDGRFYYLDEYGATVRIDLADRYLREFPDVEAPSLVELPLR